MNAPVKIDLNMGMLVTPRERRIRWLRQHCERNGVSIHEVMGDVKRRNVSNVRNAAYMHFYYEGLTMREIGKIFGRDHKAVFQGLRKQKRIEHGEDTPPKRKEWEPRQEHHDMIAEVCARTYVPVHRVLHDKATRDPAVIAAVRECAFELHEMGLRYRYIAKLLNRTDNTSKRLIAAHKKAKGL